MIRMARRGHKPQGTADHLAARIMALVQDYCDHHASVDRDVLLGALQIVEDAYGDEAPMTPADEATFIELWQQGASYRAIAQALGCPLGTVASRSAALVAQGKIQPRQRGGATRRAKARQEGAPAPVQKPLRTWGCRRNGR